MTKLDKIIFDLLDEQCDIYRFVKDVGLITIDWMTGFPIVALDHFVLFKIVDSDKASQAEFNLPEEPNLNAMKVINACCRWLELYYLLFDQLGTLVHQIDFAYELGKRIARVDYAKNECRQITQKVSKMDNIRIQLRVFRKSFN